MASSIVSMDTSLKIRRLAMGSKLWGSVIPWRFWFLYEKFKNTVHGRGGWEDPFGYREARCYNWETGFGSWEWVDGR